MHLQVEDRIDNFLLSCSELDFGKVYLSDGELGFCRELNTEIIALCRSLPKSIQTDAFFWVMKYFRVSFEQEFSVFKKYYAPAWSIVFWLIRSFSEHHKLTKKDIDNAKSAHSMALLLHPLDDHICDGQLPATHLILLLRSQAWLVMKDSMNRLGKNLIDGKQIIQDLMDEYYIGINASEEVDSLNGYIERFRKQMATGFIVPVLLSKKIGGAEDFTDALVSMYGSFGIAWRLLDDINDIKTDMIKGSKSAIYTCLSETVKEYWKIAGVEKNSDCFRIILNFILENRIVEKIIKRIYIELESAAVAADEHGLAGLAHEFGYLAEPLKNRQNPL